jgi:arylsulfatase A-like enzyme
MGWCVCSPTRAMLLTGRHPIRVGTAPEVGGELALEETTIAEGFKANGYRTGVFGKWHNGDDPEHAGVSGRLQRGLQGPAQQEAFGRSRRERARLR